MNFVDHQRKLQGKWPPDKAIWFQKLWFEYVLVVITFSIPFDLHARSGTWATSRIWVAWELDCKTVGKKYWRHDGAMLAQIKCFCMLNVFERGCSQLFPGTKILKIDSVVMENARRQVGAVNIEEILSQISKFQSCTIAKPFVIVRRFRKMWLMHLDVARSNFTSSVLFDYWIDFQNFGTWEYLRASSFKNI